MDNDGGGGGGGGRGQGRGQGNQHSSSCSNYLGDGADRLFRGFSGASSTRRPPTYFAYFNLPVYFGRRCAVIAWKRAVSAPTDSFRAHRKQWIWTVSISLSTWYRWLLVALAAAD